MTAPGPYDIAHLRHVPRRHYGRWLAAGLILVAFGFLAKAFAEGQIAWAVVGQFFTAPAILQGLVGAVWMTFCAMALGIVLGVIFAVMAMSPNPVLKAVAMFYIWFFRGTPLLALERLQQKGVYDQILTKYGLSANALKPVAVNQGKG